MVVRTSRWPAVPARCGCYPANCFRNASISRPLSSGVAVSATTRREIVWRSSGESSLSAARGESRGCAAEVKSSLLPFAFFPFPLRPNRQPGHRPEHREWRHEQEQDPASERGHHLLAFRRGQHTAAHRALRKHRVCRQRRDRRHSRDNQRTAEAPFTSVSLVSTPVHREATENTKNLKSC